MTTKVHFGILGPVQVCGDGGGVTLAGRELTLLAMLLLQVSRPVEVPRLVDAVWGDAPPRDARSRLQSCVSRLRRLLVGVPARIDLEPAGYRLVVDEQFVDLGKFHRLLGVARAAAGEGDLRAARESYRAALGLWRGTALAGVDSSMVRRAGTALDEQRVQALVERVEVEQRLGAGGELVAELTGLVADHPYQEQLHGALMVALYRAGRQTDALAAYQRLRRVLVEELGTEPGPQLQALHQRVLASDPTLLAAPVAGVDGQLAARHSLPRAVPDFTGRQETVTSLLDLAKSASSTATVVAIDGMPGVGKTSLAVYVAHLLADQYPDAQLYLDLHGHSEGHPVVPAAALEALLRQLGVAGSRIPAGQEERAALWRSELAGRRAVVLLDNAAGSGQVIPLLPSGEGCLVLVTSRRRLTGLDAAHPLSIDPLPATDAVALLAAIAGDERVNHELEAASEVVSRCGHLPLAIRLAGARLAHRPTWRVHDLAARLDHAHQLLSELAADDRTVADAFALSYAPLTGEQQRVFRLLGLHPGHDFDPSVVAALTGTQVLQARTALDILVERHLLDEVSPHRFRLHDLMREYARELSNTVDPQPERTAAQVRLLDYYLHVAAAATEPLERPGSHQYLSLGDPLRPDLVADAAPKGTAWLEEEWSNLVAAVRDSAATGQDRYTWQLARATWRYLYDRGYIDAIFVTHRQGLSAAERLGDPAAIAVMLNYLASAHYHVGDFENAETYLHRAMAEWQRSGNRVGEAGTLANLGAMFSRLGHFRSALAHYQQALSIRQRLGDVNGIGSLLMNLGIVHRTLGRYQEAIACFHRHLAVPGGTAIADRLWALNELGRARAGVGRYDAAIRLFTASVSLTRHHRVRAVESEALSLLGAAFRQTGRLDDAIARHREALAIAGEIGERAGECEARNELGVTLCAAGDVAGALAQHQAALAAAVRLKLRYEHARALEGIADCLSGADPGQAQVHWRQALTLYREMEVPEQARVEHLLSAAGQVMTTGDGGGQR